MDLEAMMLVAIPVRPLPALVEQRHHHVIQV
jgi:hypothetical protein